MENIERNYTSTGNLKDRDYASEIVEKLGEIMAKHKTLADLTRVTDPEILKERRPLTSEQHDALAKMMHLLGELSIDYYILGRISLDCSDYMDGAEEDICNMLMVMEKMG